MQFRILHVADLALVLLPFFFAKFSTSSQKQYTATWYSSSLHPQPWVQLPNQKPTEAPLVGKVPRISISYRNPLQTLPAPRKVKGSDVKSLFKIQPEGKNQTWTTISRKCAEWNRLEKLNRNLQPRLDVRWLWQPHLGVFQTNQARPIWDLELNLGNPKILKKKEQNHHFSWKLLCIAIIVGVFAFIFEP